MKATRNVILIGVCVALLAGPAIANERTTATAAGTPAGASDPRGAAQGGKLEDKAPAAGWQGDGRLAPRAAEDRASRGHVELYAQTQFRGPSTRFSRDMDSLTRRDFDGRVSSLVVNEGRWQACTEAGYKGTCRTFEPGEYADLGALNNRIASLKRLG